MTAGSTLLKYASSRSSKPNGKGSGRLESNVEIEHVCNVIVGGLATGWIPHIPALSWTQWLTLAARVAAKDFLLGGAVGAAFAMLLAGAERCRTIDSLSSQRVAAWGFLASAVPTGIVGIVSGAVIPPVTLAAGTIAGGFLGTALGVGMLRLARRSGDALPAESVTSRT